MINAIVAAILSFFGNALREWAKEVKIAEENKIKNSDLKNNLKNSKTDEERKHANVDLARRLGGD